MLARILVWQKKHLSPRNLVLLLSIVVGAGTALSACLLKMVCRQLQVFLTEDFVPGITSYLYFTLPVMGILLNGFLIQVLNKGVLTRGIPLVIHSILKNNSLLPMRNAYLQMLSTAVTVGFGGSAGVEGPGVAIGGAIGSNVGKQFRLNARRRTVLMACGAAAVTAAVFNAPITGVVFTLEILALEMRVSNLLPVLLASVTGAVVGKLLLNNGILFQYMLHETFWLGQIPFYLCLGIVSGLVATYFAKTFYFIEGKLKSIPNPFFRTLLGALLLGTLIFLLPPLFSEGYRTIRLLLAGHPEYLVSNSLLFDEIGGSRFAMLIFLGTLTLCKVMGLAFTAGSGGNGGFFAPSLYTGALTGYLFANAVNALFPPTWHLSETNCTLVGMAGVMSGIMHAPLTAIFLIAEITGGYELLIPLMLVTSLSYVTSTYFVPYSVFHSSLARSGDWIAHDPDRQVLTMLQLEPLIEKDFAIVKPENNLQDLIDAVKKSKRNIFPVLGAQKDLKGIIILDDIRHIMFQSNLYQTVFVHQIMHTPPALVDLDVDNMDSVMQHFEQSGAWNLPVVRQGKYVGILSKSKIFSAYRQLLVERGKE